MAKKSSQVLIEKAIAALISSIEVYNKPDFKYREESFCVLMINAWELLLKAKLLEDNGNSKKSLYVKFHPKKKNGEKGKGWKYKKTRTGNYLTISIVKCINRLKETSILDEITESNILTLLEFRDNATHFYNPSLELAKSLHEVGSASVTSFINYLEVWFRKNLNQFNLYLLPLSFFVDGTYKSILSLKEEKKLVDYINKTKKLHPYNSGSKNNYALFINIEFGKNSKSSSGFHLTNDPNTTGVHLSTGELQAKYPLNFNQLVEKCKSRYSNFIQNMKFFDKKANYENDPRYCYKLYFNLTNSGSSKKYYSSAILEELDKFYTKKV